MYVYISLQSKYEELFLSKLEITVSVLIKQYNNVCIVGDININVLSKNSVRLRFCNILKSHGLRYLIDLPTRTCDTAATAIDNNCITNLSKDKIIAQGIKTELSDHNRKVYTILNTSTSSWSQAQTKIFCHKYKTQNIKMLARYLSSENWI